MSRRQVLAGAGAGWAGVAVGAPRVVRIARPHFRLDAAGWYPHLLLEAALAAGSSGWTAQVADRMTDARALIELSASRAEVDVVVAMPAAERSAAIRLVPAPLYLGLFGWRVLVVPKGQAVRWQGLRTLAGLQGLRMIHGASWPDTEILRANGLQVVTGTHVPEMYDRVARGEADAFPRGITEAWGELATVAPGFEVVPGLCLHYRSDLCYFVRRDDDELARVLQHGLERLRRTHQLHQVLMAQHGDAVRQAALAQRHVVQLNNPALPAEMSRLPAAWWTPPRG